MKLKRKEKQRTKLKEKKRGASLLYIAKL
jgi:hypothetical protein